MTANTTAIAILLISFLVMIFLRFQIAYAVSIHKAQGLEYDSVKIVKGFKSPTVS